MHNILYMSSNISIGYDHLVDGLAKDGYAILDDFLSEQEVRGVIDVINFHLDQENFKRAGIGAADDFQLDKTVRGDLIKWIDPTDAREPVQQVLKRVEELIQYLNRSCYLGIKDYECHLTRYPSGSFYERHVDQFQHSTNRQVSFICYLNENWQKGDGGELRIYLEEDQHIDVEPVAGRLACFLSESIPHEVLVCHQPRMSITGWMLNQPHDLSFLLN